MNQKHVDMSDKLTEGDLYRLAASMKEDWNEQNPPNPRDPKRFPGSDLATEAMGADRIRQELENLGLNADRVLSLVNIPSNEDSLVILADRAITILQERAAARDSTVNAEEEEKTEEKEAAAPKPAKKQKLEVWVCFYTILYSLRCLANKTYAICPTSVMFNPKGG